MRDWCAVKLARFRGGMDHEAETRISRNKRSRTSLLAMVLKPRRSSVSLTVGPLERLRTWQCMHALHHPRHKHSNKPHAIVVGLRGFPATLSEDRLTLHLARWVLSLLPILALPKPDGPSQPPLSPLACCSMQSDALHCTAPPNNRRVEPMWCSSSRDLSIGYVKVCECRNIYQIGN